MTDENSPAEQSMWLAEPLNADVVNSLRRLARMEDIRHIAVMPDVHLAGDVCNGTAIATRDLIYPLAVGGDIGCGMLAVAMELDVTAICDPQAAGKCLKGLYERVPSNKHTRRTLPESLPDSLRTIPLSTPRLDSLKHRDGLYQLGTLGSGNHFVELQSAADGRLWLMLHSGSRGMGQAITGHHLKACSVQAAGLGYLDANTDAGRAYLADLNWAIDYAVENRLAMARAVEDLLQSLFAASVDWSTLIHCHHNHVRRETHFGEDLWIHRKGALPAADNEPGVIPGSMGTRSFHVTGRGCEASLRSSSHGAGRKFARQKAREQISTHQLRSQMHDVWFDERLAAGLRDEAPAAYKDIGCVMRAQRELTRIERELHPLLVYKAASLKRRNS